MEIKKTRRNFDYTEFEDRYGVKCSLQKSSLATEDCIWLGVDDANPQIMAVDAQRLGLNPKQTVGWIKYDVPEQVMFTTRMHLTRDQVAELLPYLKKFVETGEI